MERILVAYYSKSGNTRAMAEAVAEGVAEAGLEADSRPVPDLQAADLLDYAGYIFGSPTYYGLPAAAVKELFDESVAVHGRLAGRVGAAFASAANTGGGNETTVLALLQMMLVHGMVVVGVAQGDHYGPVSVGPPTARTLEQCRAHGRRVAELVQALRER